MPDGPQVLFITHLPEAEFGLWTEILDTHRVAFVHRNVFTDTLHGDLREVAATISLARSDSARPPWPLAQDKSATSSSLQLVPGGRLRVF